jgi:hypothetical protein
VGRDGITGRQHRLEGAVGERELLGVAFQEGHLQALGLGASLGALQRLGMTDAHGPAEAAGGGQCAAAAAAGYVQHALTGAQVDRFAEQLAGEQGSRSDGGGVAHRSAGSKKLLVRAGGHGTPLGRAVTARLARVAGSGQVTDSLL